MTGYLFDFNNRSYTLPVLLSWDVSHGWGEPCDAFEVSFLYTPEMAQMLYNAVGFSAHHDGRVVFNGRVDEYEVTVDGEGMVAVVRGRSLAALLLDNQCQAAQYSSVTLDYILRQHVEPLGIKSIKAGSMKTLSSFTVGSGDSSWGVLKEFCWFAGGIVPRFSPEGTLILKDSPGEPRSIDRRTPVTCAVLRDCRYGVISQMTVKNKSAGTAQTIDNAPYLSRGASCKRVINVPRKTGYDAMRYTAQYQIDKSVKGKRGLEFTLPFLFAAFPGDRVTVDYEPLRLRGQYRVYKSRCWGDKASAGTVLTLEEV